MYGEAGSIFADSLRLIMITSMGLSERAKIGPLFEVLGNEAIDTSVKVKAKSPLKQQVV